MNPSSGADYKALGDLQKKTGKTEAAIASYRRYIDLTGGDDETSAAAGMHYFRAGQYPLASKYLELVKSQAALSADVLAALGESCYKNGDCVKAVKAIESAREKKPSPSVLKTILPIAAACYEKNDNPVKAAECYSSYVKTAGVVDAEASYKSAYLQEKSNQPEAVKIYEANLKSFPRDYRNFYRLGMICSENDATLAKAASYLASATSLADTLTAAWKTLAMVQGRLKNSGAELAAYKKYLVRQPQDAEANKRVGLILVDKKQMKESITNLEIALTSMPKDQEIYIALCDAYLATNRLPQAAEMLSKAVAITPNDQNLRFRVYKLSKQSGDMKKAEEQIKQLVVQSKDNKYRILYAEDLLAMKRSDEAYQIAMEIKKADPMNIDGLMLVARSLREKKNFAESIEIYKSVLYIKEDYAPALLERGQVYLLQNSAERAKEYFQKALKADSKLALAELGLAQIARAQNNMAEYNVRLNKAKLLEPDNKQVLEEVKNSKK
jgi:tetratricopeptide (TPR) repeat protein